MNIPYFYIIQHIPSGLKYAGSRKRVGCYPNELLTPTGYKTSSNSVKKLIAKDGIESFQILEIKLESECGMDVYQYETRFLQENNVAKDPLWLNFHNNNILTPGFTTGYQWWNNGVIEQKIYDSSNLNNSWIRGRLPIRKGKLAYNDGVNMKYLYPEEVHQFPTFVLGKLPSIAKKSGNSQKGSKIYNDGEREYRIASYIDPDSKWFLGPLKNSRGNHMNGATIWNDGYKTYYVLAGQNPDPSWNRGYVPNSKKPSKTIAHNKGKTWWNDGISNFFVSSNEEIKDNWMRGMIK